MRGKVFGVFSGALFSIASAASAQTPTPVQTPVPTPTPPARQYVSDPAVVNTETTNNQRRPAVAIGNAGESLIVWNSDAAEPGFYDIKGQLYSPDGVKIGSEFQVDQAGAGHSLYTPDIASDGQGNYIVVWSDFLGNPSTDAEVWMRRFDSTASPLGPATQVNLYTTGRQRLPQVAAAPSGKFVVTWGSDGQDGSGLGVFAVQFAASAAPVGGEFAVNTYTTGDQDRPAVDMDENGFTITFNDGNGGVAAREYGASAPLADQFAVLGAGHQLPDVARLNGASNTLYVAENINTGSIDAVRSENGVPKTPFVMVPSTGKPLIGARLAMFYRPESSAASGIVDGAILTNGGYLTYEEYDNVVAEYESLCQELDLDPQLAERGPPLPLFPKNTLRGVLRAAAGTGGLLVAARQADTNRDGDQAAVETARGGDPFAGIWLILFDDNGNGVLDPNESAQMSAKLANYRLGEVGYLGSIGLLPLTLAPTNLSITDATADYGSIPSGGTGTCQSTGNCYGITVQGSRPGVHWDEAVVETLNTGVHKTWLLHIGGSFADVPTTNPFYAFIENLLHNGVTGGGACGGYCPTDGVKRQQMAVFLLKARYGPLFSPPPATGTIFADVPLSNPFAPWIEALALLGITGGCSGGPPPAPVNFCPDAIVNRQQMAVFLLKTLEGSGYIPPDAAGIFQDVPLTNPFVKWIEELYARGVTGGCVPNPLQYCPANPTNRQQMAAFLVKTFSLLLYGP